MGDYQTLMNATASNLMNIDTNSIRKTESIESAFDSQFQGINNTFNSFYSQTGASFISPSPKHELKYNDANNALFFNQNDISEQSVFNAPDSVHCQNNVFEAEDSDDCIITGISQQHNQVHPTPPAQPPDTQNNQTTAHYYETQLNCNPNDLIYQHNNDHISPANVTSNLPPEYADVAMQQIMQNYNQNFLNTTTNSGLYHPIDEWEVNPQEHILIDNQIQNINHVNYDNYGIDMINPSNGIDVFSFPTNTQFSTVPASFQNVPPQPCANNNNSSNFTKNHHISNEINVQNNLEKRIKYNQEMKRKRKIQSDKASRFKGGASTEKSAISPIEVLVGLTWRYGPASHWYDLYNVPMEANVLKFRIKPSIDSEDGEPLPIIDAASFADDEDCHLSTWQLVCWEDDVIIDSEASKSDILESNKKFAHQAGWIPSSSHRDMATFQDSTCGEYFGIWPSSSTGTMIRNPDVSQWHSIFGLENAQILDSTWISKIIIDPRHSNAQDPYLLELDLNNECIHFDFTNPQQTKEILSSELHNVYIKSSTVDEPTTVEDSCTTNTEDKPVVKPDIPNKKIEMKKMKILGKFSDVTNKEGKEKEQQTERVENVSTSLIKYCERDTYAVISEPSDKSVFSLDSDITDTHELFSPLHRHGVQHSLSAIQLDPVFFPLKIENSVLRHLHRPKLDGVKQPMIPLFITPQPIFNVIDLIKVQSEERRNHCQLTGSGDLFFMRSIADLSASIDHIVLAEYCEEYPPLMNQIGMASRITNYFSGKVSQSTSLPQLPYGELCVTPKIPFLGQLSKRQIFQTIENNMFRAPVYLHKLKPTDFLVVIKSGAICIRRINDIFLVGQELPLIEVPQPNSKRANIFVRDFLQVQIIRVFQQSQTNPKTVRHDEIKSRFRDHTDAVLRQRLKVFAEYKKDIGGNIGFWVLKPEYHLPSEEELVELLTPEECCAYYSMVWGLCRLEDAGYNSKSFMQADPDLQDDDDEKESILKIEDEVKTAPWHTTRTFLNTQKGKYNLELLGSTDPTGCGEAFSYARVNARLSSVKNKVKKPWSIFGIHAPAISKKLLSGTDADLRRLTLKKAYGLLKECGVSTRDIKKLKRWDLIDLVRQMSTMRANNCDEDKIIKYARSSKVTVVCPDDKYKSECQRIFSLQNQVLSNDDELTSDDEPSDEEDEENTDMNDEEREILRIRMMFDSQKRDKNGTNSVLFGGNGQSYRCAATADNAKNILKFKPPVPKAIPKAVCIRRQIELADGTKKTHSQTIPWSSIVKIYFKMNEEHKNDYLRNFCGLNETKVEEKPKPKPKPTARKRLKPKLNTKSARISVNWPKPIVKGNIGRKIAAAQLKVKCQNKEKLTTPQKRTRKPKKQFPMLVNPITPLPPLHHPQPIHESPSQGHTPSLPPLLPLLPTTTTTPLLSSPCEPNRYQSMADSSPLVLSCSITSPPLRSPMELQLKTPQPSPNPINHSPILPPQSILSLASPPPPPIVPLHSPVLTSPKCPLPCSLPSTPLLPPSAPSTPQEPLHPSESIGSTIECDSKPLIDNQCSQTPQVARNGKRGRKPLKPDDSNGPKRRCSKWVPPIVDQKVRGTRRCIDPRVGLNHQFEEIYKGLLQVPGYRCFLHAVRKRDCPNYSSVISKPIDLSIIKMKINKNTYETREAFLEDIKLIFDNSLRFHGATHDQTVIARHLMSHVMEQFCVKERKLMRLEKLANPLMDEDDMVGMRYILEQAVVAMEEVEYSRAFHKPVDRKKYFDYLDRIDRPMDLQTLCSNIRSDRYRSRDEFLVDAQLIVSNCVEYNGEESPLTTVAGRVLDAAHAVFRERDATCRTLERNLRLQRDDASSSQIDLSHTEDDVEVKLEEEVPVTVTVPVPVATNRARIMADLELTDSEEEEEDDEVGQSMHINGEAVRERESIFQTLGRDLALSAAPCVPCADDLLLPPVPTTIIKLEEDETAQSAAPCADDLLPRVPTTATTIIKLEEDETAQSAAPCAPCVDDLLLPRVPTATTTIIKLEEDETAPQPCDQGDGARSPVSPGTVADSTSAFDDRSNNYYNQIEPSSLGCGDAESHVTFYISDDD